MQRTSRRSFLTSMACAAVGVVAGRAMAAVGAKTRSRPNVLLVAIDDLNDWVRFLGGHPDTKTPNMDRLASRGVLFDNAHCQGPICNPSRTSLMYGLRPSTTGIYMNRPTPWQVPAFGRRVSMPRHFAAHGYKTLTTGKIYHGSGLPKNDFEVVGPRHSQRIKLDQQIQQNLPKGGAGLWDFGPQAYEEAKFIDHVDATWAAERLREPHDRPFVMAVGFYRPHVPFYAPERIFHDVPRNTVTLPPVKDDDRDDLPESAKTLTTIGSPPPHRWFVENKKWKEAVQAYLACIRWTDEQVGRVLDALDSGPYADNTLVVLYSDHGFHLGEKQRWAKFSLWERSTHVPLIVAGPGIAGGKRCHRPVELLSIYPTLIDLCGLEARADLDGTSLGPLLDNPDAPWAPPAITTLGLNNHAIRTERWRYIRYADGAEELYDHASDPNEWRNLAGDPQHADLKARLARWLPKTNVPDLAKTTPRTRKPRKKKEA